MLNVPKNSTVTIYNLGCWMVLLVMKKSIMRLVCRWERILYFKYSHRCNNFYCRSRYKLPPSNFDGTNRKAQHPVSIECFSEIISAFDFRREELLFESSFYSGIAIVIF
jgi:hypothetical protein